MAPRGDLTLRRVPPPGNERRGPGADRTLELLAQGYRFLPSLFTRRGADAIRTRLLAERTVCITGRPAVELFYDEALLRRQGALPGPLERTLFGVDPVHGLDGERHRRRKALFLSLLTPEAAMAIAADARERFSDAFSPCSQEIPLYSTMVEVLVDAISEWVGVPEGRRKERLGHDLAAIVDGLGGIGPRHLSARLARRRCERWAARLVADVRSGRLPVRSDSPLALLSHHREDGERLPLPVAASEVLNIIRPTVAVTWVIAAAATAMKRHPHWRARLAFGKDETREAFVNEARRLYPFVPALAARARHGFQWHGVQIEKGERVVLDVYGTLHDPSLWTDPLRFNPGRFDADPPDPYSFVPNGGGEPDGHRCPGERLTIELTKAAVASLAASGYALVDSGIPVRAGRIPPRVKELSLRRAAPAQRAPSVNDRPA